MRKLSLEETLRHRLRHAKRSRPRFRYRDERTASNGALFLALGMTAGLVAGASLVQKYGGFGTLSDRIRNRFSPGEDEGHHRFHGDGYHDEDEHAALSALETLEERVLDAYRNDPVLGGRAIDIGAIDDGVIELTGWVQTDDEASHAATVARGTPGVRTVVNRLVVRMADGAVPLNERWNGVDEGYGDSADDLRGGVLGEDFTNGADPGTEETARGD